MYTGRPFGTHLSNEVRPTGGAQLQILSGEIKQKEDWKRQKYWLIWVRGGRDDSMPSRFHGKRMGRRERVATRVP